ncbi:hypothetical protein K474DRAFT_1770646, partial [Panus rudis PR-1116 ss-1]
MDSTGHDLKSLSSSMSQRGSPPPTDFLGDPGVTHSLPNRPGTSTSRPRTPLGRHVLSTQNPMHPLRESLMQDPIHPSSRPRTPAATSRTPRPNGPQSGLLASEGDPQAANSGRPRSPDRPLNVTDALTYLDTVKNQFHEQPDVYNHFLDIMKDFKSQQIDTPGVIERVSTLFQGNPELIQGFNTFLPPGYKIEVSQDPRNLDRITVTTPSGILSQLNGVLGGPVRLTQSSFHAPSYLPQFGPPPVLPVGIGPGSRPSTPLIHAVPHHLPGFIDPEPYSPAMSGSQAAAAANVLGGLGGRPTEETSPKGEFNRAIQFLNQIKVRFAGEPETYKQFLEILQTYQKEQRQLHDSQVFAQVSVLFKDAPDLMQEFKAFLPEAIGPSAQQGGLIGIMPHPTAGPSTATWDQAESASNAGDKTKAPTRRRKRGVEKEPPAPVKNVGGRAAKKAKTGHKPEPGSPKFYEVPSPQPIPATHVIPPHPPRQPPLPQQAFINGNHHAPLPGPAPANIMVQPPPQEEIIFFDKVKKALDSAGTYEDFLKLLELYSMDVIDTRTLIERSDIFLDAELLAQFKELLGWEETISKEDNGPPMSIRTGYPDPALPQDPADGHGPSYRKLPPAEVKLACSGRDELARSVLNDEWLSHPTWASEESGFVAHKKSSFEETLHKSEEERHEYQVHLEQIGRTIAVFEPLDARIEEMTPEERSQFKLKPDFGGSCPHIYEKILKKIYGREAGAEVMRALQDNPSVAVPVVLSRLKQKEEEWRRLQREWSRTWREVDCKNFYKALDHQGITFKANDKKAITSKSFVQEIEAIKTEQTQARERSREFKFKRNSDANGEEFKSIPPTYGSVGYQLQYEFQDTEVLQDALKMVYAFLDHSSSHYSLSERRAVERFLKAFIPLLFTFSRDEQLLATDDNERIGEDADEEGGDEESQSGQRSATDNGRTSGVPPGDLRKRLLKTVRERSPKPKGTSSSNKDASTASTTASDTPGAAESPEVAVNDIDRSNAVDKLAVLNTHPPSKVRTNPEDCWIREFVGSSDPEGGHNNDRAGAHGAGGTSVSSRPFFANTTFYTLLRLLQLLYSRLLMCKEIGAAAAKENHASLMANPVAVELGLDDPNGPPVLLAQAIEAVGGGSGGSKPNVLYMYLLDACEKMFENELDQATFEEHMRWFFGTKAYNVFTLDRVIMAIIKQVQTVLSDNKCQELWYLLKKSRGRESATIVDMVRYRREAERNTGSDEHLYKVDWDMRTRTMRLQLMGPTEPSVEGTTEDERWREYVATYVTRYPTEWLPEGRGRMRRVFLRRCIDGDDEQAREEATSLGVWVEPGTYKLQYEAGSEQPSLLVTASTRLAWHPSHAVSPARRAHMAKPKHASSAATSSSSSCSNIAPSSGILAFLASLSASSVDGHPLDHAAPPPDFLCPSISPDYASRAPPPKPRRLRSRSDPSSSSDSPKSKRLTRTRPFVPDKYVQGPDGRWRKSENWTLYGHCTPGQCPSSVEYAAVDATATLDNSDPTPAADTAEDLSAMESKLPPGWP